MGRKELAEEIVDFFIEYKIINNLQDKSLEKCRIEKNLEDSFYVEYLIQTLFLKTKYIENMDKNRLENLLTELEKVRLNLENE